MTKKFAFFSAILGLAFSSFLSAQAPERTKPAQSTQECLDNPFKKITDCIEPASAQTKPALAATEETQPCWDDLSKNRTSEEKIDCYMQFIKEIDRQLHANQQTEELELVGVRFLKTLGYSDQVAAERVAGHFARLRASIGPVTSSQSQEIPAPAMTARPVVQAIPRVVVEETPRPQKELISRVVQVEEQPSVVVVTKPCWEETRPTDPIGCLARLDKEILIIKAGENPANRKQTKLKVKLLEVDKKRIEAQSKIRVRSARAVEVREQREIKAENNADIFCPDSRKREEVEILNTNHFIFNRFQAFNRVTISNPHGFTVRVFANDPNRNRSGAVADLPGGCTITLSRSIVPLLETSNYGSVQYSYSAQAINAPEQRGIARSQTFSLYPGNGYQQMNSYTWVINNFQTNY